MSQQAPPKNIVDGTDELIRDAINKLTGGKEWFWTKTTMNELSAVCPSETGFSDLMDSMWKRINDNWSAAGNRPGGDRNWRWSRERYIDPENEAPETILEKALASALPEAGWANQIPTASGLISSNSDRKRNIDLAHFDNGATLTLIELKIASDTPVYAAFEIIQNTLLLCLARAHPDRIKVADQRWRTTTRAQLRVVAPRVFYENESKPRALGWFESELSRAIAGFGATLPEPAKLDMDFGFRCFDLSEAFLRSTQDARVFL